MPTAAEVFSQGVQQQTSGDLASAELSYRHLIAVLPQFWEARRNLLSILHRQRRWSEAEELLRDALALDPDNGDLAFRLAAHVLADGRYEEGWRLYEARRRGGGDRPTTDPSLSFPEWSGQPVRNLLLWAEQGFGDKIMFARYAPLLRKLGIEATVFCHPALARLFESAGVKVLPAVGAVTLRGFDSWLLMGSLPLRFATTLDTIPPPLMFGAPGPEGRGVGVMVGGDPRHGNDANRSVSGAEAARLLALPGAKSLRPEHTGARDFQDTAEIIGSLKSIITVDTAVAHLAASMGKPTAVLLPFLGTDWRWLRDRNASPWYPAARLFRQPAAGDWSSAVEGAISFATT